MKKIWMRLSAIPALALVLVLWSCADLGEPTRLMGPGEVSLEETETTTGTGYTIIKESDTNVGTVEGIIDQNGGKISLGQHVLQVPAGAVGGPTVFSMSKLDGDHVMVKLTATQVTTNDIGSAGFAKPVHLTLSYKNASEVPENEQDLRILWVKSDGSKEAQTSNVDVTGKRVSADLGHFSDYAIGFPD